MGRLLIIGLFALTACHSASDSDPFKGKDADIIAAVPQGTNKKGVPPKRDVMRIDVKSTHLLREGQKRTIPIATRLLNREFTFDKLIIRDLQDILPGAEFNFDEANQKGELIVDTKDVLPEGMNIFSTVLTIDFFAFYEDVLQTVSRDMTIHIVRGDTEAPEIERIENLAARYHEGDEDTFEIYIRDRSSQEGATLYIGAAWSFTNNGAAHVICPAKGRRVVGDLGLYKYACRMSLADDQDITKNKKFLTFEINAISEFGIPAESYRETFQVFSSAVEPVFHTGRRLAFTQGQETTYKFVVVDPRSEGHVETDIKALCSQLVGKTKCQCSNPSRGPTSSCSLSWTPDNAGRVKLPLKATNTVNKNFPSMTQVKTSTMQLVFNVEEAPVVEPPTESNPPEEVNP